MEGWTPARGAVAACAAAAAAVAMFYYLERRPKQALIAGGVSILLSLIVWRMPAEGSGEGWEIGVKDSVTEDATAPAPLAPEPMSRNADGKGIYPVDVIGWEVSVPPFELMSVAEAVEIIKTQIPPKSYLSIDITNGIVDTIKALREAVEPLGYPTISRRTDKSLTMLSGPDRQLEPFEDVVTVEHVLAPTGE